MLLAYRHMRKYGVFTKVSPVRQAVLICILHMLDIEQNMYDIRQNMYDIRRTCYTSFINISYENRISKKPKISDTVF